MNGPRLEAREPSARYIVRTESALVRGFELLATADDGVARLRELILSLAIEGRLVSQNEADEPAAHVLERISVERVRSGEGNRVRRADQAGLVEGRECDFQVPRGWAVARLSDLALPQAGFAFGSSAFNDIGEGIPLIRIRDVGASNPRTFFSGSYRDEFLVNSGEWLIGMDGDFRVAAWSGPRSLLNQRVTRLIFFGSETRQQFVAMALQRELRKLQGTKAYTTVDHLSGGQIAATSIAVPPLPEQHRIVARVEELMNLCDALEQNGRLADAQHARLTSALFDALTTSETAQALAENWQRIAEHFDVLLDRPEAVDTLEQAIVQLAVRGLLVPQDVNDESASALLARIYSDKSSAAASPSGRWVKKTLPVATGEERFELPAKWKWVRLDDLSISIVDCPHSTPKFAEDGVLCIDTNSFKGGVLLPHKLRYVDESTYLERVRRLVPRPGDLVFAREGSVGESLIIPSDTVSCLGQRVMLFRLSDRVLNEFIRMTISSSDFVARLLELHKGIGAKHVNVGDMRAAVVPVPPLVEQHRIVARVKELRHLCAQLRERLNETRRTQSRLADALVAEVA